MLGCSVNLLGILYLAQTCNALGSSVEEKLCLKHAANIPIATEEGGDQRSCLSTTLGQRVVHLL